MLGPISSDRIPTPSLLPRDDDIIELLRSNDFDVRLQKMLISFLLNYDNEPAVRYEVLNELPNLFIPECRPQNWSTLVDGLTKWMLISEPKFQEKIALVLADVNTYLLSQRFEEILLGLPNAQKGICEKYRHIIFAKNKSAEVEMAESTSSGQSLSDTMATEKRNRFGIIPAMVSSMLNNDTEASTRITGLEQTKMIIEKISAEDIRKFVPHLHSYFVTLGNVLDDLNFKVVVVCLDVVRLTIERLNGHIAAHEQQIVSIISKHFGNQKAVIKQLIMNICMNLMQNVTAKSVIALLCVYLEHQNSRIREEIINVITAALLTFNTSKMNLNAIAAVIAPLLTDPKRRVRMAAFENYALLASLSSGRVETLLKYVREVEHKYRSFGLLNAVTARLSRECLPRIRYDGLIEYSSPISLDASINLRGMTQMSEFLDLDWILSANCGPSSAFSRTLSPRAVDIGSIRSVAHASSFVKAVQQQPSEERKMPWETENDYRDDMLPSPDSVPVARRHSYEEEVEAKRQQQQQQQQEQDSDGMCL
ncbi:Uncharacterized protein Tcan_11658 [Toxocara canis]|uniref:TOG domain-containing protein n=1 Tax=Toxocara canis TaxID=6265 RepID=A0A0B2VNC5_TOXCA|nr:Uncharacterized protein Tcan_11658 [Toxocara canis]